MAEYVEFQCYRTLIPNSTWGSAAEIKGNGDIPAKRIMQIVKFSVSKPEDMLDMIRCSAKAAARGTEGDRDLAEFMAKILPPQDLVDIARGRKDTIDHLLRHRPNCKCKSGEYYLQAIQGNVPAMAIKEIEAMEEERKNKAYERAIIDVGLDELRVKIKLRGKDRLPDMLELEYMMDREVSESDVLAVKGDMDYQKAIGQIRTIYHSLNEDSNLKKIPDSSYKFLRSGAFLTVQNTAQCISGKKFIKDISGVIMSGLNEAMGMREKRKHFPHEGHHEGYN